MKEFIATIEIKMMINADCELDAKSEIESQIAWIVDSLSIKDIKETYSNE